MNKNQAWRCTSIVDVGYTVDIEGRQHVANQLHTCVVRLDTAFGKEANERVRRKCSDVVQGRVFTRLANADENYGIVGLKRWDPLVKSMVCEAIGAEDEDGETGSA